MVTLTGSTPYVTPEVLLSAPTGIAWKTIPGQKSTPAQQQAEQFNICHRATSMVDNACNNVLRATIDVEQMYGPDFRMTVNGYTGVTRVELSRYPVTQVIGGQWSNAAQFPPQWQAMAADLFAVEKLPIGIYDQSAPSSQGAGGQSVLIAPGYITWFNGRNGMVLQVTYVNGWPHTALIAPAAAGATTVSVDSCTGWGPVSGGTGGAAGVIYDGGDQESVSCVSASASAGAGTLTLAAGLAYAHPAGTMISSLPGQLIQATILFAAAEALIRGATATTINTVSGVASPTVGADHYELQSLAHELCMPYRRVI
jgi:hypothetical protein